MYSKIISGGRVVGYRYAGAGETGSGRNSGRIDSLERNDKENYSRKRDEEYKTAVERGDEKKAGELVRDAAAEAMPDTKVVDADGKPLVVYHGTPIAGFTEFYTEESLAWVSVSEDQAKITEVTMSLKKDFIQTIR